MSDPTLAADPTGMMSFSGASEPGAQVSGDVVLDNIENPYGVVDILNDPDRMETRIDQAVARIIEQLPRRMGRVS